MDDKKIEYQCPLCGSDKCEIIEVKDVMKLPYGPEKLINIQKYKCLECNEVIDNSEFNDFNYEKAIEDSKRESIDMILKKLTDFGYSLASIERALDLPQRTISRWKSSGEMSSIGLALLRIICTYPWILKVAQNKYEPKYALSEHIKNAVNDLCTSYLFNVPPSKLDIINLLHVDGNKFNGIAWIEMVSDNSKHKETSICGNINIDDKFPASTSCVSIKYDVIASPK